MRGGRRLRCIFGRMQLLVRVDRIVDYCVEVVVVVVVVGEG